MTEPHQPLEVESAAAMFCRVGGFTASGLVNATNGHLGRAAGLALAELLLPRDDQTDPVTRRIPAGNAAGLLAAALCGGDLYAYEMPILELEVQAGSALRRLRAGETSPLWAEAPRTLGIYLHRALLIGVGLIHSGEACDHHLTIARGSFSSAATLVLSSPSITLAAHFGQIMADDPAWSRCAYSVNAVRAVGAEALAISVPPEPGSHFEAVQRDIAVAESARAVIH